MQQYHVKPIPNPYPPNSGTQRAQQGWNCSQLSYLCGCKPTSLMYAHHTHRASLLHLNMGQNDCVRAKAQPAVFLDGPHRAFKIPWDLPTGSHFNTHSVTNHTKLAGSLVQALDPLDNKALWKPLVDSPL